MRKKTPNFRDIIQRIKDEEIQFLDLKFVDLFGTLQHLVIAADQVDEGDLVKGFSFDGSSVKGFQSINDSDLVVCREIAGVHEINDNKIYAVKNNGSLWVKYVQRIFDKNGRAVQLKMVSAKPLPAFPFPCIARRCTSSPLPGVSPEPLPPDVLSANLPKKSAKSVFTREILFLSAFASICVHLLTAVARSPGYLMICGWSRNWRGLLTPLVMIRRRRVGFLGCQLSSAL